jgi:hypothetical protein
MGLKNLSPTHTADFGPDLEFFGPGCSVVGGSDMIAAEMEEVVDLIDDRQTVYAQECYESSEAAAAHLRKFAAAFGQRFSAMVERKRFVVFGDPSDELRALLGIYRATYHRPFGSFAYWG